MKFPDIIKKPLTGLALLAAGASANAGLTTNIDVGINETATGGSTPSGMGGYAVLLTVNNDYNTVTFDKLDIAGSFANYLADSIVAKNPNADKTQIMDDYMSTLVIPTGSDLDNAWYSSMDTNGNISVTHAPRGYETFAPDRSISLLFQGDLQDLDLNGDGVYNPLQDLSLVIDTNNSYINGVVGTSTNNIPYGGDLNVVEAVQVPEPATLTMALVGATLAAPYLRRKEE